MTKLAAKDVGRWLARPLAVSAILVHGEDRGAALEIAAQIARNVVADLADPFAVAVLDADGLRQDPARLADELGTIPFGGGKRLVRLRDAADRHTELIEAALAVVGPPRPDRLLLVEAGALTFRSSLRKLFEGQGTLAGIYCAAESAGDLGEFLKRALEAERLTADADALAALSQRLGPDRALARRAIETLALYKYGDSHRALSAETVRLVVGEAELWAFDAVVEALLSGERAKVDRALAQAFAAGTAPVGILRAALRGLQRIHLLSALMTRGMSGEAALGKLLPPVPYAMRGMYATAARRWRPDALAKILATLEEAEVLCKTTGIPEEEACTQALLTLPGLGPLFVGL